MKILLLNPSYSEKKLSMDPILTRCTGVPSKAPYIWPPVGLSYMASALREFTNSDVKILDAQIDDFKIGKVKKFDLVVINTGTPTINYDIRLSQEIKGLGPKTALMGMHAAYFHEELIKYCDFIIRCEPDKVIVNLVGNLEKGYSIKKVRGITWKEGRKIHINKHENPVENLDMLPFQGNDLLNKRYFDIIAKRHPLAFMITSRGCPYRCKFCSANTYSKKYRFRCAENVLNEIEFILERNFRDITFFDDSFTVNRKRIREICDCIGNFDISWRCLSRVDTVDREILENMKHAGCYQIQFGVESGDKRMLDLMKKGITIEKVKDTFTACDDVGIETAGFFMLGYPGENFQSIKNTIRLANEIKPDFVTFNLFTPLPGSEIFERISRREWEYYDFTSTSFCDIPSGKMVEIIGKAYKDYYLKPSYIHRRVRKTREPGRIIKQNVNFWRKRSGVLWDFIKS